MLLFLSLCITLVTKHEMHTCPKAATTALNQFLRRILRKPINTHSFASWLDVRTIDLDSYKAVYQIVIPQRIDSAFKAEDVGKTVSSNGEMV